MARFFDSGTAAHLGGSEAFESYYLVWVTARNRATGLPETMGLWTGPDNRQFTIGGQVRTYYGAGDLIGVDPIENSTGLDVIMRNISLAHISPEVATLLRGYDPRLAPIEVHIADYIPQTNVLAGAPRRVIFGSIDQSSIPTPAIGSDGVASITIASAARALTQKLTGKWSNETQQVEHPGDTFFGYANISGQVSVSWGG